MPTGAFVPLPALFKVAFVTESPFNKPATVNADGFIDVP